MLQNRGQIVINLGIIVSVAIVTIGGWLANNVRTDNKIEATAMELRAVDQQTLQRIATVEEAVATIKEDNKDIKKDIKEILKAVK